jgi:hypothetical protein
MDSSPIAKQTSCPSGMGREPQLGGAEARVVARCGPLRSSRDSVVRGVRRFLAVAPLTPILRLSAWLLATLGAIAALRSMPRFTVDDAYIVQRYADNWVQYGELVWNRGEPPVEGYTGSVLPCLYALATLLGVSGANLAALSGALALLATAAILAATVRDLGAPSPAPLLVYTLYLAIAENYTHALGGLETCLFTLALSASLYCFSRSLSDRGWDSRLLLALTLTALVRPEGLASSLSLFGLLSLKRATEGQLRPFVGRALLVTGLPLAAVLLARRLYYQSWLPNTYYAKLQAASHSEYFLQWWQFLEKATLLPLALLPLVVVVAAVLPRAIVPQRSKLMWLAVASVLILGLFSWAYMRSNLIMNYSHRFQYHAQPIVMLWVGIVVAAGVTAVKRLHSRSKGLAGSASIVLALVLSASVAVGREQLTVEREFASGYFLTLESEHRPAALWLRASLPSDATVALFPDAGIIPLLTQLPSIDFGRLNDVYLAREARSDADVVDYFFRRRPQALAIVCYPPADPAWEPAARRLLADPRMTDYQLQHRYAHPVASVRSGLCLYLLRPEGGGP